MQYYNNISNSGSDSLFPIYIVIIVVLGIAYLLFSLALSIAVPSRFFFKLLNAGYSETICAREATHILIDLNYEDALIDPKRKETLQRRIDYLARNTLLIPSRYANTNRQNREWLYRHFNQISNHIREREKWIISPTQTTLSDLRRDFADFTRIYTTGLYGNIQWNNDQEQRATIGLTQTLLKYIRFAVKILGFIAPLAFIFFYIRNPSIISPIKIDSGVLNLLFISWALIAIDSIFKLGVLEQITKTAKEIKDLS